MTVTWWNRWARVLLASSCALAAVVTLQIASWAPAGAVSGNPVLAGYVTINPVTVPGLRWMPLGQSAEQPIVADLEKNLTGPSAAGATSNVAVSRWAATDRRFGLEIILVSSSSLQKAGLADPLRDLSFYCAAQQGQPDGNAIPIHGIPGGELALCSYPASSGVRGASIAAFVRGNVAGFVVCVSTGKPLRNALLSAAATFQYDILPTHGVLVSSGTDIGLLIVWMMILALIVGGGIACVRRRKTLWGPYDAIVDALIRRRLALGISVVAVLGGLAFSLLGHSLAYLHGLNGWLESHSNDGWISWRAARLASAGGGYGHLYQFDPILQTAPGWEVVAAPFARIASGLSYPIPTLLLRPTAWLVAGPLYLSTVALPLCAGDRWLEQMGATAIRRRIVILAAMAVTLVPLALYGHPEDLVALGAMLYGLHAAFDGRRTGTGWWLGAAVAFQLLGLLAVPIAIVLLLRKRRLSTAREWFDLFLPIVGLPLLVLFVPLVVNPSGTISPLLHQQVSDFFGYITPIWHLGRGVAGIVRVGVAVAAIPAAVVMAKRRTNDAGGVAASVVWLLAIVLSVRLFEPALLPYYLGPALALFVLSAARAAWWRMLLSAALAVWLTWWVGFPIHERWSSWLILVAQFAALAALAAPLWQRAPAAAVSPEEPKPVASTAVKGSQQAARKPSGPKVPAQASSKSGTRKELPARKRSS